MRIPPSLKTMFDLFFYLLILFFILLIFGTMALAGLLAAPWVPTRRGDVKRLIELAAIKKGEVVYELGSGDGRNLFALARKYEVKIVGFEISFLPYLYSKIKLGLLNNFFVHRFKGKVKIFYKNFFNQNLSEANVVICFLIPRALSKLEDKFKKELKKGSRVVSYVFPISNLSASVVSKPTPKSNSIYLYRF